MPLVDQLRERLGPSVKAQEPLARHTTLKIGGPAEYFFEAATADDAVRALEAAKALGVPTFVLGGGSNVLVSDAGIKGLVIRMTGRSFSFSPDGLLTAEAGAPTGLVSMRASEAGLTGFEWAVGVPGTIGGAVRGNAGADGGETRDTLVSALVWQDGHVATMTNAECAFGYRDSAFKRHAGWIVLQAMFQLARAADPEASKAKLKSILLNRKAKQPVEFPTAGCMFTNWRPSAPEDVNVLRRTLDLDKDEAVPVTSQGTVPAGWIIDRAQLKGTSVGHVRVSEKHGNFFVSDGQATADDVVALTAVLKTRVRNLTDGVVQLHEEVEYAGF